MARLKVGVVGCGAIAQIQYLPLLHQAPQEFEIGALSDLSPDLLSLLGEQYRVPAERRFLDYHKLMQSDVDAVIVCSSGSHGGPAIAAAEAGKHVLVEKPMCITAKEAREMVAAAEAGSVVLMVAYMKRYDPAYRYALARIQEMADVRFVQVNHLHPDNSLHVAQFDVALAGDIPQAMQEESAAVHTRLVAEALGFSASDDVPAPVLRAYTTVLGSMIHDIGNLHGAFGPPARVLSTEIWAEGRGISTVLDYGDDKRAVCTWVDLPELWEFKETLEVYGSRERVIVSFPTGFSKGLPTTVTLHGMDGDQHPWRKELSWKEDDFDLELRHFRDCALAGRRPDTDGRSAVADIALVGDIVLAYLRREAVERNSDAD